MNKIVVYTQAYNAERTIKYTIESILSQTYDNFCYYILDNGSVDMTGKIIDEYIKKDKRIIKLINKKNNFRAMWEYLPLIINNYENAWFAVLDSDDTYHPMFFEKMLDFATNNNLDIVSCGYDTIDAKTGKLIMRRALDRNLIISGEKYRDDFIYYRRYMCGVWCKLYSFSLLKKGVLNAAEPYTYYLQSSDNAFTTKAFKLSITSPRDIIL
jgi:glycosyltransferase involved in cell wall biosynthesis